MATSIRDNLEVVLTEYEMPRMTKVFGGRHELWGMFDTLRRDFSESPCRKIT